MSVRASVPYVLSSNGHEVVVHVSYSSMNLIVYVQNEGAMEVVEAEALVNVW